MAFKFINEIEFDSNSDCQVIILDDLTVIVINDEYISTYPDSDSYYRGEESTVDIERKSIF